MALASVSAGTKVLRVEGAARARKLKAATGCAVIGLVKRPSRNSEVSITPCVEDVKALAGAGCDAVAMDATRRARPARESLDQLVDACHRQGILAIGDCDTADSYDHAVESGCDVVTTTLAGYTAARARTVGPDLGLLGEFLARGRVPVLAEGRYETEAQVRAAVRGGAAGVVVGGALNDPVKNTSRLLRAAQLPSGPTAAFDIGGTWIRFGLFSEAGELTDHDRAPVPKTQRERNDWMLQRIEGSGASRVGVSGGGTIHPRRLHVVETKSSVPDNTGYERLARQCRVPVHALNDGLATAWGHALRLEHFGRSVLTLTVGTGIGAGLVAGGRLLSGPNGEYPRLNDLTGPDGLTFEQRCGGAFLPYGWWNNPTELERVEGALRELVELATALFRPDVVLLAGSVALSCPGLRSLASPYGRNAGLYGAAAVARFPVWKDGA
jgi:N-acetylmannosamine-6-phosphate 2-epimerase/N-acetylmannosamine kinase